VSEIAESTPSKASRAFLIAGLAILLIGGAAGGYALFDGDPEPVAVVSTASPSPATTESASPSPSPSASPSTSPSMSPSASPKPSKSPTVTRTSPSALPKLRIKSISLTAKISGSSIVATVKVVSTGYGKLRIPVEFQGKTTATVYFTVTGTGSNTTIKTVSVSTSTVCATGGYVLINAQDGNGHIGDTIVGPC